MKVKPNKTHIRKWVAALRSGKFRQAKYQQYNNSGYCCLGVAEKVFCASHKRTYDKHNTLVMSGEAAEFYGIGRNPLLLSKVKGRKYQATQLNDTLRWNFTRIANAIERTFLR